MKLIKYKRSLIPACDITDLEKFKEIVNSSYDVEGVGGYKIGFSLVLKYSLPEIVKVVKNVTDLPVIYDHQKAGTDIPDTGKVFADICKQAGVDAVILFPQAGPETQAKWIESLKEQGIVVIVGGEMTHPRYKRSEGGYIIDEALNEIYLNAVNLGVTDFVVPGNRADRVYFYKKLLESKGVKPIFYLPGFITQGGELEKFFAIDNDWHAIIGRAVYKAENIKEKVKELVNQLKFKQE